MNVCSLKTTEQQVVRAAMKLAAVWGDDVSRLKGNKGLLAKLLRACVRHKKATGRAFLKRHGITCR
jgi:hypothetical protein